MQPEISFMQEIAMWLRVRSIVRERDEHVEMKDEKPPMVLALEELAREGGSLNDMLEIAEFLESFGYSDLLDEWHEKEMYGDEDVDDGDGDDEQEEGDVYDY